MLYNLFPLLPGPINQTRLNQPTTFLFKNNLMHNRKNIIQHLTNYSFLCRLLYLIWVQLWLILQGDLLDIKNGLVLFLLFIKLSKWIICWDLSSVENILSFEAKMRIGCHLFIGVIAEIRGLLSLGEKRYIWSLHFYIFISLKFNF